MPIGRIESFERDLLAQQEQERKEKARERQVFKSMVVRFGVMRMIGEFPYEGDVKPGCGSKMLLETERGTEIGEMLTSTCPNGGCNKSITRKEMLDYIEQSGGTSYPFHTDGRVLRVATTDEVQQQSRLDETRHGIVKEAQARADELGLDMRFVEAEPILGGQRLTLYFRSDARVDFRDLVQVLAGEHKTRIELRQIGARDEARLVADYERCGQHCCCKQFLKVLKPVQMKAAKMQKASLDPLKISGRCGRLMCCLRYEQETYEDLDKRLPRIRKRVGTPHGAGVVIDRQILTQLVLVKLDGTGEQIAAPYEDLIPPEEAPEPGSRAEEPRETPERPARRARAGEKGTGEKGAGGDAGDAERSTDDRAGERPQTRKKKRRKKPPKGSRGTGAQGGGADSPGAQRPEQTSGDGGESPERGEDSEQRKGGEGRRGRRRRRGRSKRRFGGSGQE